MHHAAHECIGHCADNGTVPLALLAALVQALLRSPPAHRSAAPRGVARPTAMPAAAEAGDNAGWPDGAEDLAADGAEAGEQGARDDDGVGRVASRPGSPLKSPLAALAAITAAIPRASVRCALCALRLPRRLAALAAARSSAAAALLCRVPRQRFPPSLIPQIRPSRPTGSALVLTPHASVMQRAHARAEPVVSMTWRDLGRLRTTGSCLAACMLQSIRAYPVEILEQAIHAYAPSIHPILIVYAMSIRLFPFHIGAVCSGNTT